MHIYCSWEASGGNRLKIIMVSAQEVYIIVLHIYRKGIIKGQLRLLITQLLIK